MADDSGHHTVGHPGDYDRHGANAVKVALVALAFVVFLVISMVVLNELFLAEKDRQVYDVFLKPQSQQLKDLHEWEDETLHSYKLIDSTQHVYRIPIERAMELQAADAAAKGE